MGRLRKVMVHRPGLEHARLTPSNAAELLFDDVLWVARAEAEHDAFAAVMRDRGVEVFEAEELLAQALAVPEARDWVCGHILSEREVGVSAAARAREWAAAADPALVAEFLVGGITKADVGRDVGLVWESADPTSMLLPPFEFVYPTWPVAPAPAQLVIVVIDICLFLKNRHGRVPLVLLLGLRRKMMLETPVVVSG